MPWPPRSAAPRTRRWPTWSRGSSRRPPPTRTTARSSSRTTTPTPRCWNRRSDRAERAGCDPRHVQPSPALTMSVAPLPLGPYRGFVAFAEAATDVFFGRGAVSDALLERLDSVGYGVVAVTGESGVGKTSLVRAGLAVALDKHGVGQP